MELSGKHVVVTGGSQGIGAATASEFADRGARVLVAARSEDKLRAVADRIGGEHVVADLADADVVDTFVQRCLETLGHIDVFVNNAGVESTSSFATTPRDIVRLTARLNFEATVMLTRDMLDHMLPRDDGHLVQMSSVAGAIPFPSLAAYSGTKAGINNFTESLRLELKRTNIGLTIVSPGPTDTDMWDRVVSDDRPFGDPALTRFRQLGFLPTLAPEKVAEATVDAVEGSKRFARLPKRYGAYHLLSNAPRRMVEVALIGTKLQNDWETT